MNNNPNQNQEKNGRNSNNSKNDDKGYLYSSFLKDYFESKDEEKFQCLYNDIANIFNTNKTNREIPANIKKELSNFKNANSYYLDVSINKIEFDFLFFRLMESGGFEIQQRQRIAEEMFDNIYEINDKASLNNAIKGITSKELKSIINSEKERESFLKKIFQNKVAKKKTAKLSLEEIGKIDAEKLTYDQREALLILENEGFTDYNKKYILEIINSFSIDSKKNLIETFIPALSLEEIDNLGIGIDSKEIINNLKNDHFEILKAKIENDNIAKIDELRENINELSISHRDIFISTHELFNTYGNIKEQTLNNIIKLKSENIFGEINKQAEGVKKGRSKLFENIANNKYNHISGINNFSISQDAQDVILEGVLSEENSEKKIFLHVKSFKPDSVEVIERTHSHGILEEKSGESKNLSYNEFMMLLDYFNDPNNTKTNCNIYKVANLKEKIEENKIREFKGEDKIENFQDLEALINAVDEKGKHIKLAEKMVFSFEPKDKKSSDDDSVAIGIITKIDTAGQQIQIDSQGPQTVVSFKEFYQTFKELKCKKLVSISNFQSVFDNIKNHEDTKKGFENVIYKEKEGKILPKNQENNTKHPGVEYFVNKDKKALRIKNIKSNCIEVEVGEMEENFIKGKSKTGEEKNEIKKTFTAKTKSSMSLHVFYGYITKHKLLPDINKDLIEITDKPKDKKLKEKYSPSKTFFGMQNWFTIKAGFKQFGESIKQSLKDNNDLQAAEFAMKLGKILPESMKQDLVNKSEGVMKKKMNEKVDQLSSGMDAGMAMKRVKKILNTSNPYQHEVEAVLFYVLKKYGTLYPTELKEYKGSYMWFKKLGGSLNDEIYTSYAKECIADSKPITEEDLISKLFAKQKDYSSSYYPKRRTTIVGELSKAWGEGRNEAISGGEKDTDNLTTFEARKKTVIDKLKDGQDMYAVGAMKKMYDKGGNISERNLIPFIIGITQLPKGWHETVLTNLSKISSEHQVPAMSFMAKPENIDFYNKAVLNFAKSISKEAYEELKKLQEDVSKEDNKKMIGKLEDYWHKYGSELAIKLTGNDFDIFLKSQKEDENYDSTTKEYFDTVKSIASKNGASKENKGNDVYTADSAFLLLAGGSEYLKKMLGSPTNNGFNSTNDTHSATIKSTLKKIDDIKKYKLPKNEENNISGDKEKITRERQKKLFIEINKIIALYCYSGIDLKKFVETEFYEELRSRGLWLPKKNIEDKFEKHLSSEISSPSFESKFETAFADFMSGASKDKIEKEKNNVILRVDEILGGIESDYKPKKKPKKKGNESDG